MPVFGAQGDDGGVDVGDAVDALEVGPGVRRRGVGVPAVPRAPTWSWKRTSTGNSPVNCARITSLAARTAGCQAQMA